MRHTGPPGHRRGPAMAVNSRREGQQTVNVQAETVDTRIGKLEVTHEFANGYPTTDTVDRLYDERDLQHASQPGLPVGDAGGVVRRGVVVMQSKSAAYGDFYPARDSAFRPDMDAAGVREGEMTAPHLSEPTRSPTATGREVVTDG